MPVSHGNQLRHVIAQRDMTCFIGVYDTFSAAAAAQHYDALFISGFGFAASYYGLPDMGFIAWPDMVAFVQRVRTILPQHHIMVDIDDGYGDAEIAAHVVALLARAGASGVIMEDQMRPRRCGHYDGKQLLELEPYLLKLERVLAVKGDMVVVARTDAMTDDERLRRARAFEHAGADAVLSDGLEDLGVLKRLARELRRPLMFNQIAGGKSARCSLAQLKDAGVSLVNYSTPCLFAAQEAMDKALTELKREDGMLPDPRRNGHVGVKQCTQLLRDNLARCDPREPNYTG